MKIVSTPNAPQPIGPYSQAVISGNLVFCSGQIAINPQSGEMAAPDIASQTRQVLQNLQAVLEKSGSTLSHVLKTTVYLSDMQNFPGFNAEYAKFFPTNPPARATIQVGALPKNALVEIELVAEID